MHDTTSGRVLSFLIALPLVPFVLWTNPDPDLWGHLRFGLDILRDHRLPVVDPYSFTQDVPWINHEWLHELLSAGAYQLVGVSGLIMLKAMLIAATLAVVGEALAGTTLPIQWTAVAFAALAILPLSLTIRPQVWTLFFLAVECRILATRRRFWGLPFLFVAWANLHGAWVVGAGVLIIW